MKRYGVLAMIAASIVVATLFLPLMLPGAQDGLLCGVSRVEAQENICLEQDATISALMVERLERDATISAMQLAQAYLERTVTAQSDQVNQVIVVTVPVLITATPDSFATPRVMIVTATSSQSEAQLLPTQYSEREGMALPPGCILHTVNEGDTPFGIAEQYGADGFELMEVNELDELATATIEIGDVLLVPLDGCALTALDLTPAGIDNAVLPAITVAPTEADANVAIRTIEDAGDISAEGVEIINNGNTVNVNGWTLEDTDGNVFTFAEQLLFSGASLTVYTREGRNTPVVLYWGEDEVVWQPGDTVTLKDANGDVQSTFRVP